MSSDSGNNSWQSAESLSNELLACCVSDTISEEGIRDIIARHELAHNNRDVSDYEFFLAACCNEEVTEKIIRCLLEYFPVSISDADDNGHLPLHAACHNNNVTIGIIQLLIDAAPDSVRHEDNNGLMALHHLCRNIDLDETTSSAILKLLIEKNPGAVRYANNDGYLPIHLACMMSRSPEFCRVLIEAFPGSERIGNDMKRLGSMLPLHCACMNNTAVTVKYLYKLYPDAINHATSGFYPIHLAITSLDIRLNKSAAAGVAQFLLGCDPNVKFQEVIGESLLHFACGCKYDDSCIKAALGIIEAIYEANPEFIRKEDREGQLPLHTVCMNPSQDETAAIAIVRLLLEKYPESIRHADNKGNLPIHIASIKSKSREFCRVLIEAYPESERMTNEGGKLPIHAACINNTVATVEYLYKLNPDAINHASADGYFPIHDAIRSVIHSALANHRAKTDIVKFLLGCDPKVKLQKVRGIVPPLACACFQDYNDKSIEAAIEVIELIYDAHPEAIGIDGIVRSIRHQQVQEFITSQLVYSRQARDHRLMTTPDDNGQLPLHTALQSNVRLGSIRLLVKGNPNALQTPDNSGSLPLHIACAHHDSVSVVQFLIGLDATTLDAVDHDNNTALHYACRGAKYETIAMLLDQYDAASVSKRNAQKKLPIDILWESNEVEDRESVKYTESVFRLLKAYPEMMMNCM